MVEWTQEELTIDRAAHEHNINVQLLVIEDDQGKKKEYLTEVRTDTR